MPSKPRTSGTRKPGIAFGSAGDGWGGDAKGSGKPRAAFTSETAKAARAIPVGQGTDAIRKRSRDERAERALDVIEALMETAEREETRLSAAKAVRAELIGQPVQRVVNHDGGDVSNLPDHELDAELARTRAALDAGEASARH